jgi:hypothetical protein
MNKTHLTDAPIPFDESKQAYDVYLITQSTRQKMFSEDTCEQACLTAQRIVGNSKKICEIETPQFNTMNMQQQNEYLKSLSSDQKTG